MIRRTHGASLTNFAATAHQNEKRWNQKSRGFYSVVGINVSRFNEQNSENGPTSIHYFVIRISDPWLFSSDQILVQ